MQQFWIVNKMTLVILFVLDNFPNILSVDYRLYAKVVLLIINFSTRSKSTFETIYIDLIHLSLSSY